MKLIIAIVSDDDSSAVNSTLNEHGFMATKLSTTGGFLKAGNTTYLIGTEDEKVQTAIDLIKAESSRRKEVIPAAANLGATFPVEVQVGGSTIFVMNVEQFIKA